MAETSAEFHYLEIAFATARRLLRDLPDFDIRDADDEVRLKSFVFLCHAATEEYLEKLSLSILSECRGRFASDGVMTTTTMSVLAHYETRIWKLDRDPYSSRLRDDATLMLVDVAIDAHRVALQGVHGIKSKDQEAIMGPLGVRIHDFDHVLSQFLNAYGESRGEIAHSFRIKQKSPKAACLDQVGKLQALLLPFDNFMCDQYQLTLV